MGGRVRLIADDLYFRRLGHRLRVPLEVSLKSADESSQPVPEVSQIFWVLTWPPWHAGGERVSLD